MKTNVTIVFNMKYNGLFQMYNLYKIDLEKLS